MALKERMELEEENQEMHVPSGSWPPHFGATKSVHQWLRDFNVEPTQERSELRARQRKDVDLPGQRGRLTFLVTKYGPEIPGRRHSIRVIPRTTRPSKAEQAIRRFVGQARNIEGVVEVRYLEDEDDIIIWTVVTLSLVDYDALEPLYEAEIRAMQIADAPIFDFHVVSTSQGRLVEDLVPKQAKKIWKR